jgi:hypothetical protein
MIEDAKRLIDLIESWEKSYLPTSAQIVLRDSKELIISQNKAIEELREIVTDLENLIEKIKSEQEPKRNEEQEIAPQETKKKARKNEV